MMPIDFEWYMFFQQFWVQNIMMLIFAVCFFFLMALEMLTKDDPLYMRIVPKERPSDELFQSDELT